MPFHFVAAFTNTRYHNFVGIGNDDVDVTILGYQHMQIGNMCAQRGDSGGPIYSITTQGGQDFVSAAGIASPLCQTRGCRS